MVAFIFLVLNIFFFANLVKKIHLQVGVTRLIYHQFTRSDLKPVRFLFRLKHERFQASSSCVKKLSIYFDFPGCQPGLQ